MVKFDEGVIERTKRSMRYVSEHEKELPPRTITVWLTKHDNFLSEASREGSSLVWYSDESKERGGEEKRARARYPISSPAWASASSCTTPNTQS